MDDKKKERTAPFTRKIIESADKLEVIGRHGVGVDTGIKLVRELRDFIEVRENNS